MALELTRESPDKDVATAFRKLSRKTHPDHRGSKEHQTSLHNARDTWEQAKKGQKSNWGGNRAGDRGGGSEQVLPVRQRQRVNKLLLHS